MADVAKYRKLTAGEIDDLFGPGFLARVRARYGADFTPDMWVPIDG